MPPRSRCGATCSRSRWISSGASLTRPLKRKLAPSAPGAVLKPSSAAESMTRFSCSSGVFRRTTQSVRRISLTSTVQGEAVVALSSTTTVPVLGLVT